MTTYIRGNDKKDITPFRNFLKGKNAGFHKILEFCSRCKVEKILEDSLDLIPSPLPSVIIQIIGGKVYLR